MLDVTTEPVDKIALLTGNPRRGDLDAVKESLKTFGQQKPIVVSRVTGEVIAGNHTLLAARALGWDTIAVAWSDLTPDAAKAFAIADNRTHDLGAYDDELLAALLGQIDDAALLAATGYDDTDLARLLGDTSGSIQPIATRSLAERFGTPPFSVLNAAKGEWRDRKRAWLALGINSEVGRGENLAYKDFRASNINYYQLKTKADEKAGRTMTPEEFLASPWADQLSQPGAGTSVFDPVLCEILYKWHSASGHAVLDPWAGGSVRGVVAAALGRAYTGIELRPEQVEANRDQVSVVAAAAAAGISAGSTTVAPEWIEGDATEQLRALPDESFDMVIGCPPYYDLESYGTDPRDLSNMTPEGFDAEMIATIAEVARVMKPNTFAAFVVGSVRDKNGHILDMRQCMNTAARNAGLHLHNDAILLTPTGSAAVRAARGFTGTRVLTRVHQEILIYVKGDRRTAAQNAGTPDIDLALDAFIPDDE
jgi:ParB-like chromosome segregation protein Spo0J